MLSRKITIKNPSGLHLRPAGVLSQTAMKFKSDIIIEYGEKLQRACLMLWLQVSRQVQR